MSQDALQAAGSSEQMPPSMTSILLQPVNDLQFLSQAMFLALSSQQTRAHPMPPVHAFLDCNDRLAAALQLAKRHHLNQRKIEALKDEILQLQGSWRNACLELENGNKELLVMIEEADERIESIKAVENANISYSELLSYARSLSTFTSAPPNLEITPDAVFQPPFPTEEQMRRGHLNAEEPLGPPGQTLSVGRAHSASPIAPEERLRAGHQYRVDHRPQHSTVFDLDLDLNPDL